MLYPHANSVVYISIKNKSKMNKKTIITVFLALISLGANAQLASVKELSMQSEYFGFERQVLIYTPVGYQEFDQTYYDVIYVFDSQDRSKFDLVHCLTDLLPLDEHKHFIIVGICSPGT